MVVVLHFVGTNFCELGIWTLQLGAINCVDLGFSHKVLLYNNKEI